MVRVGRRNGAALVSLLLLSIKCGTVGRNAAQRSYGWSVNRLLYRDGHAPVEWVRVGAVTALRLLRPTPTFYQMWTVGRNAAQRSYGMER